MCLHLLVPLERMCTTDRLSQWKRILQQARRGAQVLTAAAMAKSSLYVIERERGTSRTIREVVTTSRLARVRIKVQVCGGRPTVVVEEAVAVPGWKKGPPPQEILMEGGIQTEVMRWMVNFAEEINHAA